MYLEGHVRSARLLCGLALLLLLASPLLGQVQGVSEYAVKAAYLYNFAKFVEWPAGAFSSPAAPIRLCAMSDAQFAEDLKQIVACKTIAGHPIEVAAIQNPDQARSCHILFIGSLQDKNTKHILNGIRGLSVLTVGESDGFTQEGGMINFVLRDDRVMFEVNRKAAMEAHLTISSRLLSVARTVIQ